MEKIVFLADLHGNMPAVRAMEKEIEQIHPDVVWFLGDAVGKGPESDQTCDWARTRCDHFVGGNWDYGVCEFKRQGLAKDSAFYWDQLGEERMAWLDSLPKEGDVWISGIHFRLVHGRPVDKLYHGFMDDGELLEGFRSKDGSETFSGLISADSHRPYVRVVELGYALNTGSVGNGLGFPWAHALLIEGDLGSREPGPLKITTLCVPYNNHEAAEIAENTPDLPNREGYEHEVLTGIYSRLGRGQHAVE